MMTSALVGQTSSVQGELWYLAPESTVLRRFTAPGESINTGQYDPHVVPVHNGRPLQDRFSLEEHGFELISHRSSV
ncbi:MAG: hypothetical protein ACRDV8_14085, partial [Acidimicrobiales bacterium]